MKLVYLGTPDVAVAPLNALHSAGHEIVLVVSGPDKRRGRGAQTSPSPVKAAALGLGLPVTADPDDIRTVDAELGVVVAFGHMIGTALLSRLPMVNLHFSLLPRWRGAAPVERAILAGDARTGVCLMDVEETLDTGGVYARAEVAVDDIVTAVDLRAELGRLGSDLLVEALERGLGRPEPQSDSGITYAHKLTAADLELRWERTGEELNRIIRVGDAWTTFRGDRLKVIAADVVRPGVVQPESGPAESGQGPAPGSLHGTTVGCGGGTGLRLLTVQPAGRGRMDAQAWVNGARPGPQDRLGS